MKYIKLFENKEEPQVGDYVICDILNSKKLVEFFRNNIGHITYIYGKRNKDNFYKLFPYMIEYSNIPSELEDHFEYNNGRYLRVFSREEIILFSPNRQDLEDYLIAKKYNL